jgi:hypothetical protein
MNPKKFRGWCLSGCGDEIKGSATKYCSLKCAHDAQRRPPVARQCLGECGRLITRPDRKYCSSRCHLDHDFRLRAHLLESGSYHVVGTSSFVRRYLRKCLGERCTACGWAGPYPKTHKVPVEVEHIDGDWRNNRLDNLTLLCPNCHALTSTFRGLNRGRGRVHRVGGRDNPLRLHKKPVQRTADCREVIQARSIQLPLSLPT